MKRKQITKENTFKRHAVSPEGKLIVLDATKDITEKDLVQRQYNKLQSEQFDPLTVFEPKKTVGAYFISLSVLILFFSFAYLILK